MPIGEDRALLSYLPGDKALELIGVVEASCVPKHMLLEVCTPCGWTRAIRDVAAFQAKHAPCMEDRAAARYLPGDEALELVGIEVCTPCGWTRAIRDVAAFQANHAPCMEDHAAASKFPGDEALELVGIAEAREFPKHKPSRCAHHACGLRPSWTGAASTSCLMYAHNAGGVRLSGTSQLGKQALCAAVWQGCVYVENYGHVAGHHDSSIMQCCAFSLSI